MALALSVSAVALGAGNTLNTQTMKVTVSPNKVPKNKFANVKLRSVTTTGSTTTGAYAITPVDKATIYYDKDIKFDTARIPKCKRSLANLTTAQAKAKCGSAQVGRGNATVKIAGDPSGPDVITDITAFNGKPVGGHPVILLHVYSAALGTTNVQVLVGKLIKTSGKYGYRLEVTVPQLIAGTATTVFDVTVQHKPTVTKRTKRIHRRIHRHGHTIRKTIRKTIRTRHYYVSAKCSHGKWNYKGTFHYSSNGGPDRAGSLPASSSQPCIKR
jgi:hypothetical protein